MARKKKDIVVPEVSPEQPVAPKEEPVLADGGPVDRLKLTREEILQLKLAEAEGRAATYQLALRQIQRDNYIAQIDPKGLLKKVAEEIGAISKTVSDHRVAYTQAIQAIEKRLGISMKDYSFDDTTGILAKQSDM
jgi:hypothetical protein